MDDVNGKEREDANPGAPATTGERPQSPFEISNILKNASLWHLSEISLLSVDDEDNIGGAESQKGPVKEKKARKGRGADANT